MLGYKRLSVILYLCLKRCGVNLPFDLCVLISIRVDPCQVGGGKSSYAKKRRAATIGRCHRCYRVNPKFYFTKKCDGVKCVPGINHKLWVEEFIKNGIKGSN
nr:nucleic acid binding protein [Cowpea mild mottle virus]